MVPYFPQSLGDDMVSTGHALIQIVGKSPYSATCCKMGKFIRWIKIYIPYSNITICSMYLEDIFIPWINRKCNFLCAIRWDPGYSGSRVTISGTQQWDTIWVHCCIKYCRRTTLQNKERLWIKLVWTIFPLTISICVFQDWEYSR